LIEALDRGDRSAADLLGQHFRTTFTYFERHRLAGALLGKVANDTQVWDELVTHASIAVRFAGVDGELTAEFREWCADRDVDPETYWNMAHHALEVASEDRRSRPLLVAALASSDDDLVFTAIAGLVLQHDLTALPQIEATLQKYGEEKREHLVQMLAWFNSPAADAVAFQFIPEDARGEYLTLRNEFAGSQQK
jgi:hypothetical protein